MEENMNFEESKRKKKKFKKLCGRVKKQMEFYFCDSNLSKDKFLSDLISKDPDGFVNIEVFKSFNKIKTLTANCDTDICSLIAASVGKSEMFEVSEDQKRLKRTTPVDIKDFDACTLYVEKLPLHADQKWVQDVFSHFGSVKHVNVPRYKVTNKIKGFAFVEFESAEAVSNACECYKVSSGKECSASEDESKNTKNTKKIKNEDISEKKSKKSRMRSISDSSDKNDFPSSKSDLHLDASEKNLDCDHLLHKSKKKRKREDSGSDTTKKFKESTDENPDSSAAKSKEEIEMEQSDMKSVEDAAQPNKDVGADTEKSAEVHDSDMNGTEVEEGKNKRKRRKRHRSGVERPSLRVMSKYEWKAYRNKYLDLQRTTMKFIKRQILLEAQELKEQESHVKTLEFSEPKKVNQFIPGVIVKVKLLNPVKSSSEIKEQVKANAVVAYIDAPVESSEVFVRCHNSDDAVAIVREEKLSQLGKTEVLEGDDEKKYWEKIESDRKAKYNNPVQHKKRGRDKLMAKAAKLEERKNKHIYFDD